MRSGCAASKSRLYSWWSESALQLHLLPRPWPGRGRLRPWLGYLQPRAMAEVGDWLTSNREWLAILVPVVLGIASLIVPEFTAKRRLRLDLEIYHLICKTKLATPMPFREELQKELEIVLRQRDKRWRNWNRGFRRAQFMTLSIAGALLWLASLSWHTKDAAFWVPLVPGVYLISAVVHDFIWFSWDWYRLSAVGRYVEDKFLLAGDYRWIRAITIMRRER